MFTIPNQSSVPKAYTQFTDELPPSSSPDDQGEEDSGDSGDEGKLAERIEKEGGSRMIASGNRDRVVDCMEEFVKYTIHMRGVFEVMGDRYSERDERRVKEEKEREKEKRRVEGEVNGVNIAAL
jgi:arsenic resistance protein ArsH